MAREEGGEEVDLKRNGKQRKGGWKYEGREKEGEKEGEVPKIHKILILTISSMLTM